MELREQVQYYEPEQEVPERISKYVPLEPLKFDKTGKLLIYEDRAGIKNMRDNRLALILPMAVLILSSRAVLRMKYFQCIFLLPLSVFAVRALMVQHTVLSNTICRIYLHEDGKTVSTESMAANLFNDYLVQWGLRDNKTID